MVLLDRTGLILALLVPAIALFPGSCGPGPTQSPGNNSPELAIRYAVSIPRLPLDTVHIAAGITGQCAGGQLSLYLPPVYADNPLPDTIYPVICGLQVRNSSGDIQTLTTDTVELGLTPTARVTTTIGGAQAVTVEYNVTFAHKLKSAHGSPVPFLDVSAGYLQGNYLFVVPVAADNVVGLWRTPVQSTVNWIAGPNVNLYGDPQPTVSFRNLYELLFSTNAVNGLAVAARPGGLIPCRIIHVGQSGQYSQALADEAVSQASLFTDHLAPLFGNLENQPLTIITGVNTMGGLEGMHAFSMLDPWENDTLGILASVIAHEIYHCWVGIRTGETDDPWWKEGVTNYLGMVLSAQQGFTRREYLAQTLCANYAESEQVANIALSDPMVRDHLFDKTGWLMQLVYGKGAQVSMLLDVALRRAGPATFEKTIAELCNRFNGSAFGRNDFLGLLNAHAGSVIDTIFSTYVDSPGAIATTVLDSAFAELVRRGALGVDTTAAIFLRKRDAGNRSENEQKIKY